MNSGTLMGRDIVRQSDHHVFKFSCLQQVALCPGAFVRRSIDNCKRSRAQGHCSHYRVAGKVLAHRVSDPKAVAAFNKHTGVCHRI